MKSTARVTALILASMLLSCGGGGGQPDVSELPGDDVMPDVQLDTAPEILIPDTGDEPREEIFQETIDPDAIQDVPDEGGIDVPFEMPEVCECTQDEECEDAFDDLGLCERASCDRCACVRVWLEADAACDDGDLCTIDDKCDADHVCQPGQNNCNCSTDSDCTLYDDNNKCNGSYRCNLAVTPSVCHIPAETIPVCEDTLGLFCRTVGCDPETGDCININIHQGEPCQDGVDCTTGDSCADGECVGVPDALLCDDGNVCTDNACDAQAGCTMVFNDGACQDGNACTENDFCLNGSCSAGTDVDCDDSNECTNDLCDTETGCIHENLVDTLCNDGNDCTGGDYCMEGSCLAGFETCCEDQMDNDQNGKTDCEEESCKFACPVENISCIVESPTTHTGPSGDTFTAIVKVTAPGITDTTDKYDAHPKVHVQYGVGPEGADPAGLTWGDWLPATPDMDAVDASSDIWSGVVTVPAITDMSLTRDFAFRVSGDDGTTWIYCDTDGSDNGYAAENAGSITIKPPHKLLISEYMEGSGNNKAIEILNAGPFPAPLGECTVSVFFNGALTTSSIITLPALDLAPGAMFTVCHDSLTAGSAVFCDLLSSRLNFNGDDAIELKCGEAVQDVFGVIGVDPGDRWGIEPLTTLNHTLRRDCSVTAGTGAAATAFKAVEWMSLPQDVWQGFGFRLCEGDCYANEKETCCSNTFDSDRDGLADCDDPDCKATETCFIPVDWCRTFEPAMVRGSTGMTVNAIGYVFVAGKTDVTNGNDNPAGLVGQYGYGPADSIPGNDWTWDNASPTASNLSGRDDADSYRYSFVVPVADEGHYDMAFRFSADGGYSWKYCDLDGTDDGYDVADAGKLEIVSDPIVLITEYVDGTGNDKAIELLNLSGRDLNLKNCAISIYTDGAVSPSTIFNVEDGVLQDAASYVMCQTGVSTDLTPYCDEFRSLLNFNGNDTISLTCEDKLMDSFGRRGENPGASGWGTGEVTSVGHTLRRHCDVIFGDTDLSNEFDPGLEWWSFPRDSFLDLGSNLCAQACHVGGRETCCDNVNDDDLDGLQDCMDPDCDEAVECLPPVIGYAAVMMPGTGAWIFAEIPEVLFGRVFVQGITNVAGQGLGVMAQGGWGPDGSNPDGHILWSWYDAVYFDDIDGSDDRYGVSFDDVPVGTFDYAFRFSTDGGDTWTFADLEPAGTIDGYSAATTGSIVVTAGVETACDDHADNDGDLQTDCNDPDCATDPYCIEPTEETDCDDGTDEDNDGVTDCDDSDCDDDPVCQEPVDFCQLKADSPFISQTGTYFQVFGWIIEAGMTDVTTGNDNPPAVKAEVGYGPKGSSPDTWSWTATFVGLGNNSPYEDADTYYYNLFLPTTAGEYDFAIRFSADSGRSWTLCDLDGSDTGFDQDNQAGRMIVANDAPNLVISEYVEGTGVNNAIEITNLSGRDVMLNNCVLEGYPDGTSEMAYAMAIARDGILHDRDTWVVCDDDADLALAPYCDALSGLFSVNGNDTIVLKCENSLMDVFGQIGTDPGAGGWDDSGKTTVDTTMRRECYVSVGDRVRDDAFIPTAGWIHFAADNYLGLGTYECSDACYQDGHEKATDACCSDGLDNDLDGISDCDETECATTDICTPPPQLIFSEYGEGSSSNKFIEILNIGTVATDLTSCTITGYQNGASTVGYTINLTASALAAGDTWVVCHSGLDATALPNCDQVAGTVLQFNGDDAVVLRCDGEVIDSFGQVGFDPGTEWGTTPGPTTADDTLCRSVRVPDTIVNDVFDPALQWTSYGNNYFAGMGVAACR